MTGSHIFISYSRHEITFADSLARTLEERGHAVWIDYQSLVPGRVWDAQIGAALERARAVLVVVSRESVASQQVAKEWRLALEQDKRVILLIFEAQPLDADLARLEWVDFRQTFGRAVNELESMLPHTATPPAQPAPQTGRRLPPLPRLFFILSIIIAAGSLFTLPTLILPWHFLRLPRQIRRREYRARALIRALVFSLPANFIGWFIASLILTSVAPAPPDNSLYSSLYFSGLLFVVDLIIILGLWLSTMLMLALLGLTHGMYRWAGPTGVTRTRRPRKIKRPDSFVPMAVALDYANQDGRIVKELTNHLERAGHTIAADPQTADLTLVLLSGYKQKTDLNPETTRLLPVLLQTTEVDPALSSLQWIDLRRGVKRFAQASLLLGRPGQITRALGILPVRNLQQVRPPGVGRLINFFWTVLVVKGLGALAMFLLVFAPSSSYRYTPGVLVMYLLLSAFAVATTLAARRSLTNRRGVFKSALGLALALGLVAFAAFPGPMYLILLSKDNIATPETSLAGSLIATCLFMAGGPLWAALPGIPMLAGKDVRLWMARPDTPLRLLEKRKT